MCIYHNKNNWGKNHVKIIRQVRQTNYMPQNWEKPFYIQTPEAIAEV